MEIIQHHHEDVSVSLGHFSYGWGKRSNRTILHLAGRIQRTGIDCTFKLEVTRRGHSLSFPKAITLNEGEDLRALALSVKTALLNFLKETDEVPEAHRQRLCDCVLNHHLQKRIKT
jgi:hypothetical protein